ncbi:glutamate-rich protein 2 isoform X2 [Clupea harengus]|uniref:Glutamate-rich protein 2 isoform X2 n=1 Tax=Clupea harengus TaxID=7950 RepID=A0A8M1K9E3_CLUHA|nr:glutamate-rich protein 2 isoform X2 [Clupea harengus]
MYLVFVATRQTLQCVGTSTKGRSESKGSLATQLDAVCAGEPASNESVHNRSRPTARPIPKAAGEDQRASKRTATRSPKAKLNGTGEHAISPVQLHKDETENGCGTVKQPGSKVQPQSPVLAGSACDAGAPRLACPALRPSAVLEESEEQGGAAGAPLASRPVRGMCPRSGDTSDFQAGLQRDQSPSEEEEEECGDEDERPARDAPLELLAEVTGVTTG